MVRYALYAAPERDTRLWHFGNRVLGRDAETGEAVAQIVPEGFAPQDWAGFTASPRRYGFHATLKAPFALAEGRAEEELFAAVRAFAARRSPVEDIVLVPGLSGRFVFLSPPFADPRLLELANACVADFDRFRAPLAAADRTARIASGLSERQIVHLDRWGYPYVFAEFMFHLPLAGPLPDEVKDVALAGLAEGFEQGVRGERLDLRSLCVFAQSAPGEAFRLVLRAPFGGGA